MSDATRTYPYAVTAYNVDQAAFAHPTLAPVLRG